MGDTARARIHVQWSPGLPHPPPTFAAGTGSGRFFNLLIQTGTLSPQRRHFFCSGNAGMPSRRKHLNGVAFHRAAAWRAYTRSCAALSRNKLSGATVYRLLPHACVLRTHPSLRLCGRRARTLRMVPHLPPPRSWTDHLLIRMFVKRTAAGANCRRGMWTNWRDRSAAYRAYAFSHRNNSLYSMDVRRMAGGWCVLAWHTPALLHRAAHAPPLTARIQHRRGVHFALFMRLSCAPHTGLRTTRSSDNTLAAA